MHFGDVRLKNKTKQTKQKMKQQKQKPINKQTNQHLYCNSPNNRCASPESFSRVRILVSFNITNVKLR